MENRLTGKQRASRIPLDYHQHSDGIRRNRNNYTVVAVVVAIVLVAAIAVSRELHTSSVSPGPVARVHASWEQDCSVCHQGFAPIHEDAQLTILDVGGVDSTDRIKEKCTVCHKSAEHNPHQITDAAGSCTTCHHDHRGREASLTVLDDRTCTRCHKQIEKHFKQIAPAANPHSDNVTSFTTDHPEFPSLQIDPTKLKFNHKRHLSPGLRYAEENPNLAWTLSKVAENDRVRYRPLENNGAQPDEQIEVTLTCIDCHVTLAGKAVGRGSEDAAPDLKNLPRNQSPLATGAYMSPVKYEDHCRGCHPLGYDSAGKNAVPHRLEKVPLRQLLEGRFWEQQNGAPPEHKTPRPRIRPFPGQAPGQVDREAEATVAKQVRDAETHLQGVACKKCHHMQDSGLDGFVSVQPVNMPAIWLQSAEFNHMAHRGVNKRCRECHERAYPDSDDPSTQTSDVLIDGLDKCRECHSPVGVSRQPSSGETHQARSHQTGGADFRCVECHRYHRGDLSTSGTGASPAGAAGHGHGKIEQGAIEKLIAPVQEANRARD